jgi:toxin ParE1/3/4
MFDIKFTNRAEQEIKEAVDYIEQVLMNEIAADSLYSKIGTAAAKLSKDPFCRPVVRDKNLADKGLRLLPVNNYNLFYVAREDTKRVYIISFMYARRNWSALFGEGDFDV